MKKIPVFFVCAVMALSLIACGAEKDSPQNETTNVEKEDSNNEMVIVNTGDDKINDDSINDGGIEDESINAEFPLQIVVYDEKTADVIYTYEGDVKPVGCSVDMGNYNVSLNDWGNGYQCNICIVDGASSNMVADCAYYFDGNSVIFNVDMSPFSDFSFSTVDEYALWADFGAGGGKIAYAANDVVKSSEQNNSKVEESGTDTESKEFALADLLGEYRGENGAVLVFELVNGGPDYHLDMKFPNNDYISGGNYDYTAGFNESEISLDVNSGKASIISYTVMGYDVKATFYSDGHVDVNISLSGDSSMNYSGTFTK